MGKGNPAWSGGHIDSSGYKVLENRKHEHRNIMEQHLKRKLLPHELVHHKDLNKLNNSIDNLMLFQSKREHLNFHWQLTINALNSIKKTDPTIYKKIINGEFD
jgi:hypothetical protein